MLGHGRRTPGLGAERPRTKGLDMNETFLVDFDYQVLTLRRGTRPKPLLQRGKAAVEVQTTAACDVSVAYWVQARNLNAGRHAVMRHQGRLWWPLAERGSGRGPRDFLRELRAGESDLFGRPARDVRPEHTRLRRVIDDGHDDTLAVVRRRARDLLIIDDSLYAAGGVPFLVRTFVDSTPAHRSVPAPFGEIRIRPGDGEVQDWAVCHGRFHLPGHAPPKAAPMWSRYAAERARSWIETVDGDAIDPIELRIDAAFRSAWNAIVRSPARTRPPGFEGLRARFAGLCGPEGGDMLTSGRYCALQTFDRFCGDGRALPFRMKRCSLGVRLTIAAVEDLDRGAAFLKERSLTEAEEAALECLL